MSWFLGENASIDGWITIVRNVPAQAGHVGVPAEDARVGLLA